MDNYTYGGNLISKDYLVECIICIEPKLKSETFSCLACKFSNCVDCHKKYLLTTTQYPHCMNNECRSAIPYDIFLKKFNKKWIFSDYKEHRSNVLMNKEKSYIPDMIKEIAIQKDIEAKKKEYYNDIYELRRKIHDIELKIHDIELNILNLNPSKIDKKKYQYNFACPVENCKGFLDSEYKCGLCNSLICSKCYDIKSKGINTSMGASYNINKNDDHVCDPDKISTFNTIKRDARPCPQCGEFISKSSGCDQMFCTVCSCSFSYTTGIIEKGIIHNPLAFDYFQKNPDAHEAYMNRINNPNNTGENGVCRPPIPNIYNIQTFCVLCNVNYDYIRKVHQYVSEFRQYKRDDIIRFLNNDNDIDDNKDIRRKYLNNEYNDKMFKSILHKRNKNNLFLKLLYPIIIFTYEFAETILWSMVDISNKYKAVVGKKIIGIEKEGVIQILKNLELLKDMSLQTQNNITQLKNDFNYTRECIFTEKYYFIHK